jgi:hypothetical protein
MNNRKALPGRVVGFVDMVFAVIIGVSLTGYFDALKRGEVTLWSFETWTLGLTYLAIVYSWVGYHKSIERRPHTDKIGVARFAVDLVILLVYFVLVYFFDDFGLIIQAFAVLFALYLGWGVLKMWEHRAWDEWKRYAWRVPSLAVCLLVAGCWRAGIRFEWPEGWHVFPLLTLVLSVYWYRRF